MMFLTQSAPLISALANHPDIRPTIEAGCERIDVRSFMNEPGNIAYACEDGMVLFNPLFDGVYRGHIAFLKSGRGAHALACGRWVLDDLYDKNKVIAVVAGVPLPLRAARLFCRMLGFVHECQDAEQEWMIYTGGSHGRSN
jgi:hypothetical protein